MKRPLNALAVLIGVIATFAVASSASPASAAQPPAPQAMLTSSTTVPISADAWSSAGLATGQLSVFVHLQGEPVWRVVDAAAKGGRPLAKTRVHAVRRDIARRQLPTVRAVEAIGARVIERFQGGLNALQVDCTPAQLARIAALPGVVSISKVPVHAVDNKDVGPWTGAVQVAKDLGFDGKDVTIAVIDTGIDYTHKGFDGSGNVADFTGNDPTTTDDGGFPTTKVIGGVDLAGEFYGPGCPQETPTCTRTPIQDDDPLDTSTAPNVKHGTHVSGTAAGIATDKVAAGTAPGANLVAIKVFGSPAGIQGTTNLAMAGLEWIFNHNTGLDDPDADVPGHRPTVAIDVVNLSLGAPYGPGVAEYAEMTAALHQAGVTVVASAGNNSNVHYIAGSPASTEMILSVANTHASGEQEQTFRATWTQDGAAKQLETGYLGDDNWLPKITAPLVAKPIAYFGSACNGAPNEPLQDVSEKFALVERGTCTFVEKVRNAQAQGAIGVVVFSDNRPKSVMGGGTPPYPTIPAVIIDRKDGLDIRDLVQKSIAVLITIDPTKLLTLPWKTDTIAFSSSRGPSRATGGIKPNISAPGENTFSVLGGSGTEGVNMSGTSMAGPAVAGIVALLAQRNRVQDLGMTPADLAALAMNYAVPVIRDDRNDTGPLVGVTRQGAGRVNALASAKGSVVVRSDRGLAELSLGDLHVTDAPDAPATVERELTVRSLVDGVKYFRLSSQLAFPAEDADKGIDVSFPDELITLHGRDEVTVGVHFDLTPAKMRAWELFGLDAMTAAKEPIFRTHEFDGYVFLTETNDAGEPIANGEVLHVPFHALPHRHSCIASTTTDPAVIDSRTPAVDHRYEHPCGLPGPMTVSHLGGVDVEESATPTKGMPSAIDIGAVGVSAGTVKVNDGMGGTRDVAIVQFSLTTFGPRRSPVILGYKILIDADMDGKWDRAIFPYPENRVAPAAAEGRFLVAWANVDPVSLNPIGQLAAAFIQPYDISESVTQFAVPAADVIPGSDVAAGTLSFRYAAVITDQYKDFAETSSFLGEDMAPDTLVDGDGYTFDMARDGCLALEDSANPQTLDPFDPNVVTNFPARSQGNFKLVSRCTDLEEDIETGVLSTYRTNKPDHDGWQARAVTIRRSGGMIFLPYASSLHIMEGRDVPTATTEAPTEVPTVDPSLPTAEVPTPDPELPTATVAPNPTVQPYPVAKARLEVPHSRLRDAVRQITASRTIE